MVNESFFNVEVPAMLQKFNTDSKPLWGNLTPQHMIEHLVSSWRISNGRAQAPVIVDGEELKAKREFLFSDKPFPKNVKNRLMGEGLVPLRKKSLEDAINQLLDEIDEFFRFHQDNPGKEFNHPMFGSLDRDGWLKFQHKHMLHHFIQFNLL